MHQPGFTHGREWDSASCKFYVNFPLLTSYLDSYCRTLGIEMLPYSLGGMMQKKSFCAVAMLPQP